MESYESPLVWSLERERGSCLPKDKLKICELVKNKRSLHRVVAEFGVGKSTVADIVKNEEKIQVSHDEVQDIDGLKKQKIIRRADFEELDRAMYYWFIQQRCKG